MAHTDPLLIDALRRTARRLETGATYRWTHMGTCNCGHLAQTVTRLSPQEIHRRALEKAGDWSQQALDHCPTSGYPMDHVLEALFALGLHRDDLVHLERLSCPEVLAGLPRGQHHLCHRRREDVVRYFRAWADVVEARWMAQQAVPEALPAVPEAFPGPGSAVVVNGPKAV